LACFHGSLVLLPGIHFRICRSENEFDDKTMPQEMPLEGIFLITLKCFIIASDGIVPIISCRL
jgi:hypothetical protein